MAYRYSRSAPKRAKADTPPATIADMRAAITRHYAGRPCIRPATADDLKPHAIVAVWDCGEWQYTGRVLTSLNDPPRYCVRIEANERGDWVNLTDSDDNGEFALLGVCAATLTVDPQPAL